MYAREGQHSVGRPQVLSSEWRAVWCRQCQGSDGGRLVAGLAVLLCIPVTTLAPARPVSLRLGPGEHFSPRLNMDMGQPRPL